MRVAPSLFPPSPAARRALAQAASCRELASLAGDDQERARFVQYARGCLRDARTANMANRGLRGEG